MENNSHAVITTDSIHNDFFKKSHHLVFSQLSFSSVEHDIFALLLIRLHEDHWQDFQSGKTPESPTYIFTSDVLCEWFNTKKDDLYNILKAPAERLSARVIGVTTENSKSFDFITLFKRIKYENGKLVIIPNDQLMNQYLHIAGGHAQIFHKPFRAIKSEHGKRLYSMLCRFKGDEQKLHTQSIQSLHGFFGLLDRNGKLVKTTYKTNSNFINRIIKPAIAAIKEQDPNIEFDFDGKTGNEGFAYKKKVGRL
ncbi:replication initiation protein (plasmid) [Photobacterium leiognathi subsp. mandapamensis]|uniref:replication initiation protein n=1 Tax=Photobacterium leiognathi TaxID=553611 RepID=UPI003AF36377